MQIKYIESANPIPEAPHKLHVVLRVVVDTPEGPVEKSREVPVRKVFYKSLTAAKQLAYATKCHNLHHLEDQSVRAEFDADDKAKADAAAAVAKAAQDAADAAVAKEAYERFAVRAVSIDGDKATVSITHHNVTIQATIPADPATVEQNARAAFAEYEAAEAKKAEVLAAFAIG